MTKETFEQVKKEIETSELTQEEINTLRQSINESKSGMTEEQYNGLLEALDKAAESVRPFTVVKGDTLAVVGDANDTKVNKYTYEIIFTKPTYDDEGNITGEASETKTYNNVYIKPRQQTKVVKILTTILPYFRKVNEDGSVGKYTPFELAEIFSSMDEVVYDLMYDLMAYILDIPDEEKDYMELASVLKATLSLFMDFPEAVNEADSFFE